MRLENYFFYTTTLNDKSFQKNILDSIDKSEDIQRHKTNVKAKMTSYLMQNEPGFVDLSLYIVKCAEELSFLKWNVHLKFIVHSMWGMCYESNNYAIPHDHLPAFLSCVYYINPPKNSPGLSFPEINRIIYPDDGTLVFFPSWVVHEVVSKPFQGKRYAVSANLFVIPP